MVAFFVNVPITNQSDGEDHFFNVTKTLASNLPDAIYTCYTIPVNSYNLWTYHFEQFADIDDFQGAFIQNLMGNMISFMDMYNKT